MPVDHRSLRPSGRLFPIRHSEGEAILVRMFDPRRHPLSDWTIDGADSADLEETFHTIKCTWPGGRPLAVAMRREVEIDVDGYDLLVLCVQSMRSTAITVRAIVDGSPRVIVDRAPGIDAGQELEGPIGGRRISALEIELSDPGDMPGVRPICSGSASPTAPRATPGGDASCRIPTTGTTCCCPTAPTIPRRSRNSASFSTRPTWSGCGRACRDPPGGRCTPACATWPIPIAAASRGAASATPSTTTRCATATAATGSTRRTTGSTSRRCASAPSWACWTAIGSCCASRCTTPWPPRTATSGRRAS